MRLLMPAAFLLFESVPSTGNPMLDAAMHYGSMAVLALSLWILLARTEQRYTALATEYKSEMASSIRVRTEILGRLTDLHTELVEMRQEREDEREELLRRIEQIVRQK